MTDAGNEKKLPRLEDGKMRFIDNFVPHLRDGDYEIRVRHTLEGGTPAGDGEHRFELPDTSADGSKKLKSFSASQRFTVRGPRFVLPGTDVHSTSPPAAHAGRFSDDLPHIVLSKRGLPWERKLQSVPGAKLPWKELPWMALVVFRADELLLDAEPKPLSNPTRAGTFVVADVLGGDGIDGGLPEGVYGPRIGVHEAGADAHPSESSLSEEEAATRTETACFAIDIARETFERVMPTLSEARRLAHVRQVDTGDKEILGIKDDGWFSVVVANRFPAHDPDYDRGAEPKPAHLPNSTPWAAHLVSLEGLETCLSGERPKCPDGYDRVRLVSLARWAFDVTPEPAESFADLMYGLVEPVLEKKHDLMLRVPIPEGAERPGSSAARRLADGYVPLSYRTRPGEATFGWYRGPLAPERVRFFLDATGDESGRLSAPTRAAEAYVYDPTTGVFDLSYGVAFMTGRAMALSDSVFAQAVMNWRRRMHELLDRVHARLTAGHERLLAGDGGLTAVAAHELEELIEDRLFGERFIAKLVGELGDEILPTGTVAAPREHPRTSEPAIRDRTVRAELDTILQTPAIKELLEGVPESLPEQIVLWLAERMLLQGVPFDNLVPSASMLPVESIRFFYLDRNWLSCLVDGALSVGTHTSRDSALYELLRGPVQEAVYEIVHRLRDRARDQRDRERDASERPEADQELLSGFLLRSAVVSGWPGLEVKAFSTAEDRADARITLLHMKRLSPDVLLVLFPQIPQRVELNEPREGLAFGYEVKRSGAEDSEHKITRDVFELRHVEGAGVGHPVLDESKDPVTGSFAWRDEEARVIDVAGTAKNVATGLGGNGSEEIGPAALALNLIKVPEQMILQVPGGGSA